MILTTRTSNQFVVDPKKDIELIVEDRLPSHFYFLICSHVFVENIKQFSMLCLLKRLKIKNTFEGSRLHSGVIIKTEKDLENLLEIIFLMKGDYQIKFKEIRYDKPTALFEQIKTDFKNNEI